MTMASYIAILRKEADSDFGVDYPDFPGVITAGRTLEEARQMAAEALDLHVDGLIADGEAIPEPSALDAIMADLHNREGVAILVDLPKKSVRSVRINVTLPEDLIEAIDRETDNRSRFLAEAARKQLHAA
jgi:predicted RNase H-like HicB family nuclease